jgi:hypothetical protein
LPDGTNLEHLEAAVVETWTAILEALKDELENRSATIVSQPVALAGIGVVTTELSLSLTT